MDNKPSGPVTILVDSGNTTAATAAISLTCANRLGLTWTEITPRKISTASTKDAGLTVRGEINNLHLKLEGGAKPLVLKNAWVVDPLGGDVNLGIKFLEQHQVALDWTRCKNNRPVMRLQSSGQEVICTMESVPEDEQPEDTGIPILEMAEVLTDLQMKLPKPIMVGPCQGRRVHLRLKDVPPDANSLYVPGGGTCDLLVVEGLYCVKPDLNQEALVEVMLLNTTENTIEVDTNKLANQTMSLCRRVGMHMPGAKLPLTNTEATLSTPQIAQIQTSDRAEEVIRELQLDEKKILKDDPKDMRAARALITKYADIFTTKKEGQVGVTDLVELDIKMTPGTPIRQRVRPLNPTMKESLDEQIQDWLRQGVIQASESEYSSPLVPVKKKDGEVCWCVDF